MSYLNQRAKGFLFAVPVACLLAFGGVGGGFMPCATAHAAETSLLVSLPVEINESLVRLDQGKAESARALKAKTGQMSDIKTKLKNSRTDKEQLACKKEYLAVRSEILVDITRHVIMVEGELTGIYDRLNDLEDAMQDSKEFRLGPGISRFDKQARKTVGGTILGFKSMINMVEALDGDLYVGQMKDNITADITQAQAYFNQEGAMSVAELRRTIMDTIILTRKLRGMIKTDSMHLSLATQKLDIENIKKSISKFTSNDFGGTRGIADYFRDMRQMDDEVLGHGKGRSDGAPMNYRSEWHNNELGF